MKYKCNECYKSSPCVLEFKTIGDTEPNQCPFNTKNITGDQAVAKWKKVKENLTTASTGQPK